jgi:hypothetical protein
MGGANRTLPKHLGGFAVRHPNGRLVRPGNHHAHKRTGRMAESMNDTYRRMPIKLNSLKS